MNMKIISNSIFKIAILALFVVNIQCVIYAQRKSSYVKTYMTRNGRVVKGHFRKSFSTSPNAFKNRAKSQYYYHTKGKYTRRKKS